MAQQHVLQHLTRAAKKLWKGELGEVASLEQGPVVISGESLLSTNNANTGTVPLISSDANDVTQLSNPNGTSYGTGGQVAIAGSGHAAGRWVHGYVPNTTTSGTNTAGVQNQQFLGPVFVPVNATITGVAFLIGTTGGTDKAIVALYDNTGALLANSTTAGGGTTVGTGSTLQSLPFTATFAAKGPQTYWASVQYSGNTAKLQTIPLGTASAGIHTASGSSPDASITLPTTFTANQGPVAQLY